MPSTSFAITSPARGASVPESAKDSMVSITPSKSCEFKNELAEIWQFIGLYLGSGRRVNAHPLQRVKGVVSIFKCASWPVLLDKSINLIGIFLVYEGEAN